MKDFLLAALPVVAIGTCLAFFFGKRPKNTEKTYMTEGMCMGMALGIALESAFGGNLSIGLSLGMLVGEVLGMQIPKKED